MKEWTSAILLVSGSLFMFVAALGVIRFPDLFTRMHAATKAASFGVGLMLIAVAIYFSETWVFIQVVLVIGFIFLTAPVASHMIGRAACFLQVPLWHGTIVNDLDGQYDLENKCLNSPEQYVNNDS